MSDGDKSEVGAISWTDLTVPNADEVREFYKRVVGWTTTNVEMGGYNDYCMNAPASGATIAGVCHARGGNAGLPAQWLVYINVRNLDASATACTECGGAIFVGPKGMGGMGRYCVIRDPAGAVAALFEPARSAKAAKPAKRAKRARPANRERKKAPVHASKGRGSVKKR